MALGMAVALTPRQQECVMHTWLGLSNREIGRRLGCSERTVRRDLWRAHQRLGIAGRGNARILAAVWLWKACQCRVGQLHKGG